MNGTHLSEIVKNLRDTSDPIARGKELLIEEYRKTNGAKDDRVRIMAQYELMKSMCIQAAYELFCDGKDASWLEVGALEMEITDAKDESLNYMRRGMEHMLSKADPDYLKDEKNILRIKQDQETSDYRRFVGSVREYIPGIGYAISIRKREGQNQDSFLIDKGTPSIMAVADGCSGSMFSSIASSNAVRDLARKRESLLMSPKRTISEINGEIADLLSDELMKKLLGTYNGGSTTLTLAISDDYGVRFYKVGDSLPFRCLDNCTSRSVESVSSNNLLLNVLGQTVALEDSEIEERFEKPGQVILTTDGVTNYAEEFASRINSVVNMTNDAVMIAENIIRSVLRGQIFFDFADDATIIVQEISR